MAEQQTKEQELEAVVQSMVGMFAAGGTLGDLKGLDETHYETIYAAGHAQYTAGRYEQAEQVFKFLTIHNPYDRRFPLALGSVKQVKGEYDQAIGYYSMAMVLDMMDPVAVFHTAECMTALGRADDAVEALGFVIRNSDKPEHRAYKERSEAMIKILKQGGPV